MCSFSRVSEHAIMICICFLPRPCLRFLKYSLLGAFVMVLLVIFMVDKHTDIILINSINFESAITVKEPYAYENVHVPAANVTSELDTEGTWERSTYTLKPDSVALNTSHTRGPSGLIRNKTRQDAKKLLRLSNFLKRTQTIYEDQKMPNESHTQNMTNKLTEKH